MPAPVASVVIPTRNRVEELRALIRSALGQTVPVEVMVMDDPNVDQGSCVLETNSGLIDASFSTQLGILRQLLGTYEP